MEKKTNIRTHMHTHTRTHTCTHTHTMGGVGEERGSLTLLWLFGTKNGKEEKFLLLREGGGERGQYLVHTKTKTKNEKKKYTKVMGESYTCV